MRGDRSAQGEPSSSSRPRALFCVHPLPKAGSDSAPCTFAPSQIMLAQLQVNYSLQSTLGTGKMDDFLPRRKQSCSFFLGLRNAGGSGVSAALPSPNCCSPLDFKEEFEMDRRIHNQRPSLAECLWESRHPSGVGMGGWIIPSFSAFIPWMEAALEPRGAEQDLALPLVLIPR